MLGWRGYRVGKLLKSWRPNAAEESSEPAAGQRV
jgi:hypothetical protein